MIEGTRIFLDTPEKYLEEVFLTERFLEQEGDAAAAKFKILEQNNIPVYHVTDEIMAKASDTLTPQGVLCSVKMPEYDREEILGTGEGSPLILVLENIQDPGNLGTMFRTAEAAGVTGIVMTKGTVDVFNPKTVRSTMSALFRMPFIVTENLREEIAWMKERSIRTYAAYLGGKRYYDAPSYTEGCAFLIGNEGNGLTPQTAESADEKILIPMEGEIESLNAAMAAGIMMYEAYRQRRSV